MKGHVLFVFGAQACIPEDALSAAKEMGLRVSVIAPHAPCGEATALVDRLECRSVARADEAINTALAIHHEQRIDGVLAYDDQAVPVVARIAAALGLPGHPVVAADAARDKFLMKERFTAAGIPIAAYALVEDEKAALKWADGTGYPVVVKPVRGSASQGVIRADNEEELQNAYRRLRRIVREFRLDTGRRSDAEQLIEKYLPGSEFSVELLLQRGTPHVLCTFEKPLPLEGPYFEETIYVTPPGVSEEVRGQLEELAVRAAIALGLRDGAAHCELRLSGSQAFVLEVGARLIGGACSRVFHHALGGSIHPSLLRIAMGQSVDPPQQGSAAAGAMMLPIVSEGRLKSVNGVELARSVPGVRDVIVTASPGDVILPFPEQSCYVGFLTAVGATPSETAAALSQAANAIEFGLDPLKCEWWSCDLKRFTGTKRTEGSSFQTLEHLSNEQARERVIHVLAAAHFGYLPVATALERARECIDGLETAGLGVTQPSLWVLADDDRGVALGSIDGAAGYISCLAAVASADGVALEMALASAILELLAGRGAETIHVEVDPRQPSTASVYRQLGFAPQTTSCGCSC